MISTRITLNFKLNSGSKHIYLTKFKCLNNSCAAFNRKIQADWGLKLQSSV